MFQSCHAEASGNVRGVVVVALIQGGDVEPVVTVNEVFDAVSVQLAVELTVDDADELEIVDSVRAGVESLVDVELGPLKLEDENVAAESDVVGVWLCENGTVS